MAENNTDTIQTDVDFYKFLNLLPTALPDHLHYLIRDKHDEIHKIFCNLSLYERRAYIDILSGGASEFRNRLLREESSGCSVASVPQLFDELRKLNMMANRLADMRAVIKFEMKAIGRPFFFTHSEEYGNPINGTGSTGFQHQRSAPSNGTSVHDGQEMASALHGEVKRICVFGGDHGNPNNGAGHTWNQHQGSGPSNGTPVHHDTAGLHSNTAGTDVAISVAGHGTPPYHDTTGLHSNTADMRRSFHASLAENYGNPNNGTGSTGFQRQRSGPSNGSLVLHDTAGLHSNSAGTDVATSAAGHVTPPYHATNTVGTDLAISIAGSQSVPKPSYATVPDDVTNLMKEIFDSLKGNPQLARDHLKWFTTLLGINGGVIITLISKSTSNNPQSLSTEIMESLTALSAVVGFSASLAGLYLTTNKPQTLPFSCDSEVATRKMGIVGGIATAFAFMAGVLLLLPNNPFRWITLGLASAAFLIPVLIKLLR